MSIKFSQNLNYFSEKQTKQQKQQQANQFTFSFNTIIVQ